MPEDMMTMALPPFRVWERGGARPVLALHCSLAHSGAWAGLAAELSGVTITATDQPGHGRAEDWDGVADLHGIATAASIAMAEQLGSNGPIDLFGHSFGGTLALRVALERPDLVRSLTLVEPVIFAAAKAAQDPAYAAFWPVHTAFARKIAAGETNAAALDFHALWGGSEPFEAMPARTQDYILRRIHLIAAQNPYLLEDGAGLLRPGGLEAISVPVLLIEGADSPEIIPAVHAALAARLPQVSRLAVPGAGHMVSITHAAEIAPVVQAHLARS